METGVSILGFVIIIKRIPDLQAALSALPLLWVPQLFNVLRFEFSGFGVLEFNWYLHFQHRLSCKHNNDVQQER